MRKSYRISLKTVIVIASVLLVTTATAAYASFNLTGTGQVTITAPIETAIFVGGQVGNSRCTVTNSGNSLSCPNVSIQEWNTTSLIFEIKNTGTITLNLKIQVIPDNTTALLASPTSNESPSILAPGSTGTYEWALTGEATGSSGFTISVTPLPLPPSAQP